MNVGDILLRSERPRIRDDEPPPRQLMNSRIARDVLEMRRGSWVQVTHQRAKSYARVIRQKGGQAMVYRTSETFSVCRVLEAPWAVDDTTAATSAAPTALVRHD